MLEGREKMRKLPQYIDRSGCRIRLADEASAAVLCLGYAWAPRCPTYRKQGCATVASVQHNPFVDSHFRRKMSHGRKARTAELTG